MAYTSNANFTFSPSGYTADTNFSFSAGESPTQGAVEIVGNTPSMTYGVVLTVNQETVEISGLIPDEITEAIIQAVGGTPSLEIGQNLTPDQAIVYVSGDIPIEYPTIGVIDAIGGTPSLIIGQVLTPIQSVIDVTGGKPGVVILTANAETVDVFGDTPTFGAKLVVQPGLSGHRFNMILSAGAGPELRIPISSISGQLRADGLSSMNVVIPDGYSYANAIANEIAFDGGHFQIESIDLFTDQSELVSLSEIFDIDTIRSDKGAKSYSITLRGTDTLPANVGRRIQLSGVSYISTQANGKTRVRSDYNSNVLPGDVVVFDDGDIVVDSVTQVIGISQMYMECAD